MALLTEEDREEIKEVIEKAINDSQCRCGLSKNAQAEVSHLMGVAKDLGDGDRGKGIECMRDLFKFWAKVRKTGERIGVSLIRAIVLALASGLAALIYLGLKTKIGD